MLTKKELLQLRNEITLNSLFLKDYENTLFIKPETVLNFFNSYLDYCYENECNDLDISDLLEKYDNIDAIYNYYLIYENDPLCKDNFKFIYNINVYYAIVIYDFECYIDDYVYVGMLDGYRQVKKITLNKIFYDKNGCEYIAVYKQKYYLKDFMRANY